MSIGWYWYTRVTGVCSIEYVVCCDGVVSVVSRRIAIRISLILTVFILERGPGNLRY